MTKAYKIELYGVLIFPVICVLLLSYPSWREFLGSFEVPTNMDDMMDSVLFYLLLIVFAEAF